jgi:membrane protein
MAFARAHRDQPLPPSSLTKVKGHPAPTRTPAFTRRTLRILTRTAKAFLDDNVSRLGAALAFYTTIAVAPLMVIAIAVAGIVFDEGAREQVIGQIQSLAGRQAGEAISAVQSPANSTAGAGTTALSIVTLIFGAFGVFYHFQEALNSIWRVKQESAKGWRKFLKQRIFSFATLLASGFLLIVSLIASAVLSFLSSQAGARFGLSLVTLQIVNNTISFVVTTCLFAMIFKLLPDAPVRWHHVWLGAVVTAVLFTVGKSGLGLYLGRASVTSAYGAAGSLIVLLLWCYYAAQIVFLGAEFTRVTALSNGGRDFGPLDEDEKRTV